jgi:ribosomal protein L22
MTPDKLEPEPPAGDAPASSAGRSDEPGAAAETEQTRPASAADATPTADPADDVDASADEAQEPEALADDEDPAAPAADDEDPAAPPADDADPAAPAADAPKRARRPRARRKAAEPAAAAEKPAPPAPTPTRRRSRRDPDLPAPVVRAQAKYVRSSARKARLVCDHIRGKSVEEARAILALTPRAIALDWSKLLESAVANAEHNHELVGEDLYVKAVHADEGPTIKRFRPRAMGRATQIRKRTSHLTILLTPKD